MDDALPHWDWTTARPVGLATELFPQTVASRTMQTLSLMPAIVPDRARPEPTRPLTCMFRELVMSRPLMVEPALPWKEIPLARRSTLPEMQLPWPPLARA